jgi:Lon protease-like protein
MPVLLASGGRRERVGSVTPRKLAMFPLSTVLFPLTQIPLHVFEPRYRQLTADCLAGDARFGIVLITRGSEVGGGDQRMAVGTQAVITQSATLEDGRCLLLVRGESRIRVVEWLEDAPYPVAMVEDLPSAAATREADKLAQVIQCVRRTRGLLSETRESPALSADVTFDGDPEIASWQLCAEAPVSVFDAQRLLSTEGATARLDLLLELTEDLEGDLHRMLAEE